MSRDAQTLEISSGSKDFHASLLGGCPSGWVDFESELVDAGVPISLPNRVAWAGAHPDHRCRYLTIRNGGGSAEAAAVIQIQNSRAIPGWRIARVERIGPSRTDEGRMALLTALSRISLLEPRILRLHVGVFAAEARVLSQCTAHLSGLGFQPKPNPSAYIETLVLPLSSPQEELFSRLHRTARRHVRAVGKKPVFIKAVEDPSMAPRLKELSRETFTRTRSVPPELDWEALIRFSAAHPGLSRILGLYEADTEDESGLLSFAWGCFNGDHAHYAAAASTRKSGIKVPLGYGLMWELILWAKASGGTFFDLGGIPGRVIGPADPLWGIDKFKRYFASEIQQVGAEFLLEHNSIFGSASRAVSSAVGWLKGHAGRGNGGS